MRNQQFILLLIASILCLTFGFGTGYLVHAYFPLSGANFPILIEAYTLLDNHGLEDLPSPPAIEYGMIRGMLTAYGDPYSIFVEPVQHELESNKLEGKFGGIGAQLNWDKDGYIILYPFQDSPAAKAGIHEGDRLVGVDDLEIITQTPIETVLAAIRGPEGTQVKIKVARPPAYTVQEFTIKRVIITLPSVTWNLDSDERRLGILKINRIATSTPDEIKHAITDLQKQGASHFILDLRDNRGGLLTAGVNAARLFLSQGVVIQQEYRGQSVETFNVETPGPFIDLPLAVLVNHDTASAAEILAGALKVHKRAGLIGQPTYGKDTIQVVFDLKDKSSLHITSAHWWVPDLEPPVDGHGLQPDILIPEEAMNSRQIIEKAIEVLFAE